MTEQKDYGSLIRNNLMRREGYSPYCGFNGKCFFNWPRTVFRNDQFHCKCGWVSQIDKEFIQEYKEKWGIK